MNFDLHIHSIASKYKEDIKILKNSTIENVGLLLSKLDENKVGLFSITDHNRFDVELYKKIDSELASNKFINVKSILAGVEFDVKIDAHMNKCHIITIFDAKNKEENYNKIYDAINENKLMKKDGFYTKEEFESILKKIGLNVILIACQRSSLSQNNGKNNSLSGSTKNSKEMIKAGYINALEFQRPNVEGILKDNLKEIPFNIGLVMGSDCHDWNEYPRHDSKNYNEKFAHSRAKILPTFKGLLMAITSPKTRINQQENSNHNYIEKFLIGEKEIPLVNGINTIIGENGSGKSTLLKLLGNMTNSNNYTKKIVDNNKLSCKNEWPNKTLFIGQGEIINKFELKTLFPKNNFKEIDNSEFKKVYTDYANEIMSYIKSNIKAKEAVDKLAKKYFQYKKIVNCSTYFIRIVNGSKFEENSNIHEKPKKNLSEIINNIQNLLEDNYFKSYANNLKEAKKILVSIYNEILKSYEIVSRENNLKNIITSKIKDYKDCISDATTSEDKEKERFFDEKAKFIESIVSAIKMSIKENIFPKKPKIMNGFQKKESRGFNFNSEANYHEKDVHEDFLSTIFNKNYANINKIKEIDTEKALLDAIKGCSSNGEIDIIYKENTQKFIKRMCESKNYIVDISNNSKTLGNTLGEQSLAYFKYITEYEQDKCIFLIDQPEDHISNNNISKNLIKHLDSIRHKKQIIIVTHNPLLVVNQDAENVIFIEKKNDKLNIISGCLESEYQDGNMLKIVADNMDGGKSAIEKRLKVYG